MAYPDPRAEEENISFPSW
jgi:hypothetical protein